ncbi:hypothetical protein PIB30_060655 [Stylosanthes scabra]|uniref:Uncharacterized protein n=1 Tax=Stylosanthes scabra TaxID=79078 RepID=A0ABU6UKH5_9FABA|nr:hypothetical protein [Stylosanthes scabra]
MDFHLKKISHSVKWSTGGVSPYPKGRSVNGLETNPGSSHPLPLGTGAVRVWMPTHCLAYAYASASYMHAAQVWWVAAEKNTNTGNRSLSKEQGTSKNRNQARDDGVNNSIARNHTTSEAEKNSTTKTNTVDPNDTSSNDEDDTNPNKKGMCPDKYFEVHGINVTDEEEKDDEESAHDENAENVDGWYCTTI